MTTLPLAEVRANLSRIVEDAVNTHQRVEITRNGVRSAVVLSADDYDALIETLDIVADASLMDDIRTALAELADGDVLSTADVLANLPAERRPR